MNVPVYRLGEICHTTSGGTPSRARKEYFGGTVPWVKSGDLTDGVVVSCAENITEAGLANSSAKIFQKGTVIIAMYGATVGKLGVLGMNAATNQAICGITPLEQIDPGYLFYFLLSQRENLIALSTGGAQPNISQKILRDLQMLVPLLSQQRRIVDILSRSENIVRLRNEAQERVEKIAPSIFLAMFGDPSSNLIRWPVQPLGTLAVKGPQNGLYKHKSYYGEGTPILRIDAFYDGAIQDLSSLQRLRLESEEIAKYGIEEDDIIINRVNSIEYLGKSALVPALKEPVVFESNMMRLRLDLKLLNPLYFIALLQTTYARSALISNAKRAINQASINQQDVSSLQIPLPPLKLQEEFANHVRALNGLSAQQAVSRAKANETLMALMSNSFIT